MGYELYPAVLINKRSACLLNPSKLLNLNRALKKCFFIIVALSVLKQTYSTPKNKKAGGTPQATFRQLR